MSKVQPRKNCKLQKNNNLIIGVTRNFLQTRAKQYEGTQKQNKRIRVSFVKSQFFSLTSCCITNLGYFNSKTNLFLSVLAVCSKISTVYTEPQIVQRHPLVVVMSTLGCHGNDLLWDSEVHLQPLLMVVYLSAPGPCISPSPRPFKPG